MALLPLLPRPSCLHTSKEWMINAYKHSSRPPPSSCLQHLSGVRWPWPWPLLPWFRAGPGQMAKCLPGGTETLHPEKDRTLHKTSFGELLFDSIHLWDFILQILWTLPRWWSRSIIHQQWASLLYFFPSTLEKLSKYSQGILTMTIKDHIQEGKHKPTFVHLDRCLATWIFCCASNWSWLSWPTLFVRL